MGKEQKDLLILEQGVIDAEQRIPRWKMSVSEWVQLSMHWEFFRYPQLGEQVITHGSYADFCYLRRVYPMLVCWVKLGFATVTIAFFPTFSTPGAHAKLLPPSCKIPWTFCLHSCSVWFVETLPPRRHWCHLMCPYFLSFLLLGGPQFPNKCRKRLID